MNRPNLNETIDAMIKEQGESWLEALPDRTTTWNAVVITDSPDHCYRLKFWDGEWVKVKSSLTNEELASFFAAFGSHWKVLLSSWLTSTSGLVPIRAFIANGRKPRSGFSISIVISKSFQPEQVKAAA